MLEPLTNKLHFQEEKFDINAIGLKRLWHFHPLLQKYHVNSTQQKQYLQMQLKHMSLKGMQIANLLYKKRQTIEDLPPWVFTNFRKINSPDNVSKYLNQS